MEKILISQYCKKMREKTGFSVNAFAKSRGVSHTYILDVESGKKDKPSIAMLNKLINTYHFSSEDLSQLDVHPYMLDEAISQYLILHPFQAIQRGSIEFQIFNFIHKHLEPKRYVVEESPILETKSRQRKSIKIDTNGFLVAIYDLCGINPQGNKFFAFVLSSAHRSLTDDKYYEFIFTQMINFIDSIRYSAIDFHDNPIEIIFISLSAQANEAVKKASKVFQKENLTITISPYFFNIKIGEPDN